MKRMEDGDLIGCYKASLTVEASFILIITMSVLLALFLLMFTVYHENVDFITDKMGDYNYDSVKAFRFVQALASLRR